MGQQGNDRYADYVSVAERVGKFYEDWPAGRIHTVIREHDAAAGTIIFRAEVYRELTEDSPSATGHASELRDAMPSHMRASYLEVCESSAVGRALMLLGYETKRAKAERQQQPARPHPVESPRPPTGPRNADREVMTALEILQKDEDWLNARVAKQMQWEGDWSDMPAGLKDRLLAGLNNMVNEKAAEAR